MILRKSLLNVHYFVGVKEEEGIITLDTLYKKLFDNVEQYTILKNKRLEQTAHIEVSAGEQDFKEEIQNTEIVKRAKLHVKIS